MSTRTELAAELEQLDQEIVRVEGRARRTVDVARCAALEAQLEALREERRCVVVELTAAELRAMRDSPHPPESMVPRKTVGPVFGALIARRVLSVHSNRRKAS